MRACSGPRQLSALSLGQRPSPPHPRAPLLSQPPYGLASIFCQPVTDSPGQATPETAPSPAGGLSPLKLIPGPLDLICFSVCGVWGGLAWRRGGHR